jgi:hypothetical protein
LGTLGLLLKAIIIKAREGQDKKEFNVKNKDFIKAREGQDKKEFNVKNKDLKQEKEEDKEIIYRAFLNFSDCLQIRSNNFN